MPIGQVIAQRIKSNVKELHVVDLTKSKDDKQNQVKKLKNKMTCVTPQERLLASEVLACLQQLMQKDQALSYSDENPSMPGNDGKTHHEDSMHLKPPEVKLNRVSGWDSTLLSNDDCEEQKSRKRRSP